MMMNDSKAGLDAIAQALDEIGAVFTGLDISVSAHGDATVQASRIIAQAMVYSAAIQANGSDGKYVSMKTMQSMHTDFCANMGWENDKRPPHWYRGRGEQYMDIAHKFRPRWWQRRWWRKEIREWERKRRK